MPIFNDRLKEALKIRNFTQQKLADTTGLSKMRISHYINKPHIANKDAIILIAKALNVNIEWLMGLDVPMEPSIEEKEGNLLGNPFYLPKEDYKIPVYRSIKAGDGRLGTIDGEIERYICISDEYKKMNVFAMLVVGESMEPVANDGEIALLKPLVSKEQMKTTSIYAVEVESWASWVLKKVINDPSGMIQLISVNKNYKPMEINPNVESVTIKGKLIECRRIILD